MKLLKSFNLSTILNKIIEFGFYGLFFATPLLFNPSRTLPSFELFEWNKIWFMYFLTVFIVGAWIGKMIIGKKILIKRTPFDVPIIIFLIFQALSTLFSIDQHVSFFGYYSRFHGGLLSTIVYTLLYYALVTNFYLLNFKRLILFIFSSAFIVAIYGILEKFGIDADMWIQDVRARVFSTLGQPNWLAAYIAILLPLSIVNIWNKFNSSSKIVKAKTQNSNVKFNFINIFPKKIQIQQIISFTFCMLLYICLLFTKSRSGFLGFWGANIIFWLIISLLNFTDIKKAANWLFGKIKYYLSSKNNLKTVFWSKFIIFTKYVLKNNYLKLFILTHVVFLLLNFIFTTPFPQYNKFLTYEIFLKTSLPEIQPAVGDTVINVGITDSAEIRKVVWKGAWEIAKNYPLFGTGPETFAYSYYKFRPKEHNLTSEWDFLYNKAHNEYLNFAANNGYLGLGIYLLLIGWVLVWTGIQIFKFSTNKIPGQARNDIFIIALLASYISILITNFFGFSVVIVGIYFSLIPAFLFCINQNQNKKTIDMQEKLNNSQKILFTILGLTVLYFIVLLSKNWIADSFYSKSNSLDKTENYAESFRYIQTAIDLNKNEPVYHDQKANVSAYLTVAALKSENSTLAAKLAIEAVNESSKALKISPQNINFWKTRTRVLFILSEYNPSFIQSAYDAIKISQDLAPTDAKIAYNVAVIAGRAGKKEEAVSALEKTIDLKPDYRDAYIALSIFYEETGNKIKAREILELALKKINPNDQEIIQRLGKL